MKVGAAHTVNGQTGPADTLASLLGGSENASFASLLDIGGNEPGAGDRMEESQGKQGNRSREKESDEKRSPALKNSGPDVTPNSLGMQILSSASGTPWRLEPADFGKAGDEKDQDSLQLGTEAASAQLQFHPRPASDVRTVNDREPNLQQVRDEKTAGAVPFSDPGDPEPAEPTKATSKNRDATATTAIAASDDQDATSTLTQSSSATPGVIQPSGRLVGTGEGGLILQGQADSSLTGVSVIQRYTAGSNHAAKPDGGRQDAATIGEQWNDLTMENGGGQGSMSAPLQRVVDRSACSSAGDHAQGGGTDAHRGSFDTREVTAGGHAATPQASESSLLGRMGPDGSMHEHGVLTNSNHPESIRESAPNAQLRDPTWPWTEDASARLVESAMRGDLRVGVHTEAFGRVTIQTNAQGGQLSAQLSLENPKESAALAAHLPGVEQKIVQEHGLNASVRLVGGSDGSTGAGSMGRDHSGGGPERERYRNDVATRPRDIEHDFSNESRGVEAAFIGTRYLGSSRLDVTV